MPSTQPAARTDHPSALDHDGDAPAVMSAPRRVALIDGIRGIAIVLVVLSHGWVLWPIERIDETAWIRPLFRSGNFAVTVFLVAAGYFTYVSLASRGLENMRPGVTFVRRVLRVGPSLWLLLAVVLLVSTLEKVSTSPSDGRARAELETIASRLERAFLEHLELEERSIFPLVDRLPDDVQRAILAEIRARRAHVSGR